MFRSIRKAQAAFLFATAILLALSLHFCLHEAGPVLKAVERVDRTPGRSQQRSNKEGVKHTAAKGGMPEHAEAISITLPFSEQSGVPVAAILEDTNHWGNDWGPAFPGRPMKYQQGMRPRLAVWADGRVVWRADNEERYYQSHIKARLVEEMLLSIRKKDCRTTDNMRYSRLGSQLDEEDYATLFVSKGRGQYVVLCSPFHYWKDFGVYMHWDESSDRPDVYHTDEYSWSAFCENVPPKFIGYLNAWDSLEAELLSLKPNPSQSVEIDLIKDVKQISYSYELASGRLLVAERGPIAAHLAKSLNVNLTESGIRFPSVE